MVKLDSSIVNRAVQSSFWRPVLQSCVSNKTHLNQIIDVWVCLSSTLQDTGPPEASLDIPAVNPGNVGREISSNKLPSIIFVSQTNWCNGTCFVSNPWETEKYISTCIVVRPHIITGYISGSHTRPAGLCAATRNRDDCKQFVEQDIIDIYTNVFFAGNLT